LHNPSNAGGTSTSRTYEEQGKKRKVDETHIDMYNNKKENKIFLIYKEIQKRAVAKSI
jgi:hypothetical protein